MFSLTQNEYYDIMRSIANKYWNKPSRYYKVLDLLDKHVVIEPFIAPENYPELQEALRHFDKLVELPHCRIYKTHANESFYYFLLGLLESFTIKGCSSYSGWAINDEKQALLTYREGDIALHLYYKQEAYEAAKGWYYENC
jgi:hypothetical protein